ncbi:mRNA decapping enzyme 2 [Echinococcus multilocularis]|uniref:mRNA-decapping enzyme 2 n=1 Tax=Echinococcus multilocularis TaxID=6211 RepID=A0A068Y1C3_ECHMU|nr:mRNA decapping enzyme 2 [Echinococcus multilocularis]
MSWSNSFTRSKLVKAGVEERNIEPITLTNVCPGRPEVSLYRMQNQPTRIPEATLKLLYSLFISNTPQSLKDNWKSNFTRIFSELEYAHWFYLDNCLQDKNEIGLDLFGLCQEIFTRFPHLIPKKTDWKEKFFEWKRYRGTTCTGSAIVLDEYLSMVLLVQGFNNNRWTFPGGKVGQGETLQDCAIREVMEETGLDIEHRIDRNLFLEVVVGETTHRAYIVEGFPRTSRLQPSTQNEIEAITWFSLVNLPSHLQDNAAVAKMNFKPSHFFCVIPFVKRLREYVKLRQQGVAPTTALGRSTHTRKQSSVPPSASCIHKPSYSAATAFTAEPPLSSAFTLARPLSTDRVLIHPATPPIYQHLPPLLPQLSPLHSPFRLSSLGGSHDPPPTIHNHYDEIHLLSVDSTVGKDSIWGGRVKLNSDALVDIFAPLSRDAPSLPTLHLFDAAK